MKQNILDIRYCLMMQAKYNAQARQTNDAKLKATYEAAARKLAERIRQLATNRLIEPISE